MSPDFTGLLLTGIVLGVTVPGFMAWRFGRTNTGVFVVVVGLFPAGMDFLSSCVARNYEYPGQSRLWVFSYIFFGWIGVCGTCMLLAEGLLARPGEDLLSQPCLGWQVPAATGLIAVSLDLFIDPVTVGAGYWVWLVPGEVYFRIPLLNFVGWFVLMLLAPLAWIPIARQRTWGSGRKLGAALGVLVPLSIAALGLSVTLTGAFAAAGLR